MILCCGEALIDMIPMPTASGQTGFVPHSGGAVFNTAIALGRLGTDVGMVTALSEDMFGQQLLADLNASHVDTNHIIRSPRPSTLAFVQLTGGQARYAFFDENTAERMVRANDFPSLPAEAKALYFGGISLAREPGGAAYVDLARRNSADLVVMLDPNIRPGFVEDEDAYRARLETMIGLADIVKVSDEDLEWLHPGADGQEDKINHLRRSGPRVVILTRGAKGAIAWLSGGAMVEAPTVTVKVADTVGAGDTFNAGVLARLDELGLLGKDALASIAEEQLQSALSFGASVAAVTVSRPGANPPWREEL